MTLVVTSPVAGAVVPLTAVPDPVFAGAVVGPGLAVEPAVGVHDVVAPVAGTVVKLHPHAFVLLTPSGQGVLVHLGIDTVRLHGEGFELLVAQEDVVEAGQVLVRYDVAAVVAAGRAPVVPVVVLDTPAGALTDLRGEGPVAVGDALFTVAAAGVPA